MDNVDGLVIEHLKKIQAELAAGRERDGEMLTRLGRLDIAIAGLRRDMAHFDEATAEVSVRMDRLSSRVERIERRLEING